MMRAALPLSGLMLLAAACSDSTTTVGLAEACKPELDGKLIRTEGHLHAPFASACRAERRRDAATRVCSFDLRDKPDGAQRLSLSIEVGNAESRVDQARLDAKAGAAAVADDARRFLADKARVRVTGTLRALPNALKPGETICWLDVEKIERR
jgi:hypothetical protein